jgi:hypothetical protein
MTAAGARADLSAVEAWLSLVGGELSAEIHTVSGVLEGTQRFPPGAPLRPPADAELAAKITDCVAGLGTDPASWTWDNAAQVLEGLCRASTG